MGAKRTTLIFRERLQARVRSALSKRVMLLCAPAGFGKSVAIRDALNELEITHVTYNFEPAQTSPAALAHGLAAALKDLTPGLASSYATAAEYALQSNDPRQGLALWFQRHLQDVAVTIVLEDAHHAAPDAGTCALLQALIESAAKIRWILTTRSLPPLPIERWHNEGIAEPPITEDDLRLTQIEAAELAHACNFPENLVPTLYGETMGWPLAFHLGTTLPGEIEELARMRPRTPKEAYDFLLRRLFDGYGARLRDVLVNTSAFTTLDRELLAASPWHESWGDLAKLAEKGLLLSKGPKGTLRFHDLFHSFLSRELQSRGETSRALETGARALERCGRIPEAMRLYVQAEMRADVLRLCEEHGFALMEQGRREAISAALNAIGEEQQNASAILLALRALNESLKGRNDTAESWFLHGIEKATLPHVRAEIAYRYALDLIRHGRLDAIEILEPYAKLPDLPSALGATIHSTLATAYVLASRFDEGSAAMRSALDLLPGGESGALQAKIYHQAAWVALFTGDIENAKHYANLAVYHAIQCGMYDTAARAYSVLYNISYDVEDDPEAAKDSLEALLDCGMKAGSPQLRLYALLCRLDLAAEAGDYDDVQRIVETLNAHEVDLSDPVTSETLLPAQALQMASQGDFEEAHRLLAASGARQLTPDRRALRFSEIALYAAAARQLAVARNALAEVLPALGEFEPGARRTVRTRLNCALAFYLVGETAQARAMLENATLSTPGRLDAFREAVETVFRRWDGERNSGTVARAFDTLRDRHFGGIADVLAALPSAPQKHAAFARVQ